MDTVDTSLDSDLQSEVLDIKAEHSVAINSPGIGTEVICSVRDATPEECINIHEESAS